MPSNCWVTQDFKVKWYQRCVFQIFYTRWNGQMNSHYAKLLLSSFTFTFYCIWWTHYISLLLLYILTKRQNYIAKLKHCPTLLEVTHGTQHKQTHGGVGTWNKFHANDLVFKIIKEPYQWKFIFLLTIFQRMLPKLLGDFVNIFSVWKSTRKNIGWQLHGLVDHCIISVFLVMLHTWQSNCTMLYLTAFKFSSYFLKSKQSVPGKKDYVTWSK